MPLICAAGPRAPIVANCPPGTQSSDMVCMGGYQLGPRVGVPVRWPSKVRAGITFRQAIAAGAVLVLVGEQIEIEVPPVVRREAVETVRLP